ncbi:MAG: PilW family protein [Burkholderiaceae bacterium]
MDIQFTCKPLPSTKQSGLTLVELMVSIALGLLVVLAATALLLSSKSAYMSQSDSANFQDTARYAMENIVRSVRQAGYENWDKEEQDAPITATPEMSANLSGVDGNGVVGGIGIDSLTGKSVNGSDVLAVRFFGVSKIGSTTPDGTVFDCAGNDISAPIDQSDANTGRGWSIYYVANGAADEPELRCRYRKDGGTTWKSEAIAGGIESFQVLYGVDTDYVPSTGKGADRIPNQFLTATQINAKDSALTLVGADAAAKSLDKNRKTWWKRVSVIKVAMLVRGTANVRADTTATTYDLFGKEYSTANAASDIGSQIKEANLPADTRNMGRKVFLTTIQLRNQSEGSGS